MLLSNRFFFSPTHIMLDIIFSRFKSGKKDQHDESTVGVLFSGITQNKFYSSWDLMSTSFFVSIFEKNSFFHHSLRYLFIFFAQWDFFRLDCDKTERMKNCIKICDTFQSFINLCSRRPERIFIELLICGFHRNVVWQIRLEKAAQRQHLTPRHSTHCHDICACKRH